MQGKTSTKGTVVINIWRSGIVTIFAYVFFQAGIQYQAKYVSFRG